MCPGLENYRVFVVTGRVGTIEKELQLEVSAISMVDDPGRPINGSDFPIVRKFLTPAEIVGRSELLSLSLFSLSLVHFPFSLTN